AAGQHFRIDVTDQANTQVNVQTGLALQDQWRRGGLESEHVSIPPNPSNATELKVVGKGTWLQPDNLGPTLEWYQSGQIASAQNNLTGQNVTGYNNPEFDRRYGESLSTPGL